MPTVLKFTVVIVDAVMVDVCRVLLKIFVIYAFCVKELTAVI